MSDDDFEKKPRRKNNSSRISQYLFISFPDLPKSFRRRNERKTTNFRSLIVLSSTRLKRLPISSEFSRPTRESRDRARKRDDRLAAPLDGERGKKQCEQGACARNKHALQIYNDGASIREGDCSYIMNGSCN